MADSAICSQIRAFLTPKFAGKRSFRLRFTYNRRDYTIVFIAKHNDEELNLYNSTTMCINIEYNYEESILFTNISADNAEPSCFTPRLMSNTRMVGTARTTTMDVLTVLMTKLCLCFPTTILNETPIEITDMAAKDDISLSAFNLLRGGFAIYEKYGFVSPFILELRRRIPTIRWQELIQSAKELILTVYKENGIRALIRNDDLLVNIVKPITFEIEKEFNYRHMGDPTNGTDALNFSEFMMMYLFIGAPYYDEFTLDETSPEWTDWSSRLVFTEFTLLDGVGGGRKTRTRTRRRTRRRRV
jgi:hypothetical protein